MAASVAETQDARNALDNVEAPVPTPEQAVDLPHTGEGDGDQDQVVDEVDGDYTRNYNDVARDTVTIELNLYREDKANDFFTTYREVSDLAFKRLGLPSGSLVAVDTSPYKKIILEIDAAVEIQRLNITQTLQVRKGLWTKPLQSPENSRLVNIKWAPMKMASADIESVLSLFGEMTRPVEHVVIQDCGEDWQKAMAGVKTADRCCKMKIRVNIPSQIVIRGQKMRIDYSGQPKTCSRCQKYWTACPGGGKVEKCKKAGGQEVDVKAHFKKLVNTLKKKSKGGSGTEVIMGPVVPEVIPDPDMVRFSGFPEDFNLEKFTTWLDEMEISFLQPMVFKGNKPGVFLIETVEVDGESYKLSAEEAAHMVTKLNGVTVERRRVSVQMAALSTPTKRKPEVVTLDDSGEASQPGQLALPAPGAGADGGAAAEASAEAAASSLGTEKTSDSDEDLMEQSVEEVDEEDESGGSGEGGEKEKREKGSLKLKFKTDITKTGTKNTRVVGGKAKREDSDTSSASIDASPDLSQKSVPKTNSNGKNSKNSQKSPNNKSPNSGKPSKKKGRRNNHKNF